MQRYHTIRVVLHWLLALMVMATLLLALIGLHIQAALFHHFIRPDGLLRPIWFGHRISPSSGESA